MKDLFGGKTPQQMLDDLLEAERFGTRPMPFSAINFIRSMGAVRCITVAQAVRIEEIFREVFHDRR